MLRTMSDIEGTFDKPMQGGISHLLESNSSRKITMSDLIASYSPPQVCKRSLFAELGELQELIPYEVGSPIEYCLTRFNQPMPVY